MSVNVDRSRFLGILRACSADVFPGRSRKSVRLQASQRLNVEKLRGLLQRSGVFSNHEVCREFEDDYFWCQVQMPNAQGSDKQVANEAIVMSLGEERLFNVLCTAEESRIDRADSDMECDDESLMSSRAGSVARRMEDDDDDSLSDDDDVMNSTTVEECLKRMANVRRKPRSNILFQELLGADGDEAMKGMDVQHMKEKAREINKELVVRVANHHFESKMEKRTEKLAIKRQQSKDKSYRCIELGWRNRYRSAIQNRRIHLNK